MGLPSLGLFGYVVYIERVVWLFWKRAGELVLPSLRKQMCWREGAAGTRCAPCAHLPRQVLQLQRVLPRNSLPALEVCAVPLNPRLSVE